MEWVHEAFSAIDAEFVEFLQAHYFWPETFDDDGWCGGDDSTFEKLDFLLDYENAVQNYTTTMRYRTTFAPSQQTSSIRNTSPGSAP
mgnify:CR=1 FL=1